METLRIFVAGATGVIGRRLVEQLSDRGHIVIGLTRDRAGDELVAERGGVPRRGDVLDSTSLEWAIGDADVVVNLATSIPSGRTPDEEDWRYNDRVRQVGTRNLTVEAGRAGAHRFVQSSIVWTVRKNNGSEVNEFTPPNPDRRTRSAVEAERRARAARKFDLDPVVLRTGWLYAPDAVHTRQTGRDLLRWRLPIIGGGLFGLKNATLSILHAEDAASAFAAACEGGEPGTYHVIDDDPVTPATFLRTFADRLGAKRPLRVPGWLVRPVVGPALVRFFTTGFPTSNDPFTEEFGWKPTYPTYREGLEDVVTQWVADGILSGSGDGYEWVGQENRSDPE